MRSFKTLLIICFLFFFAQKTFGDEVWQNDLKSLFLSDGAIVYGINIRTFNSKDLNKNGIIEEELGEERGTFLNAIDRLDELKILGINTVHLFPVTPVGKTKALGTAGSLYAITAFSELNPQLKSPKSDLSINEEMRKFVRECHKRKIRVIVDLPSCGAYDLYLNNPELFKKDENQNPIIPADWTDVRLFDAGTDKQINMDLYFLYKDFIDFMTEMNVDGVRVDSACLKPYFFWRKLIDETRRNNPDFLFLADTSPLTTKSPSPYAVFTPYNKLLEAGFDGYYGSYSDIKDWKTKNDVISRIKSDIEISKQNKGQKSCLGVFASHDQTSPILVNGPQFSRLILWLSATLPINSYYLDGFSSGDTYIYPLMNKKANKTFTDDEYYFVHRGQFDIFNFSRKPEGKYYDLTQDFIIANKFKILAHDVIANGTFIPLRTSSASVFAYARSFNSASIVVMGNLDFRKTIQVTVNVPKLNSKTPSVPIKIYNIPQIFSGKIKTQLDPGEIQVMFFNSLEIK